LNDPLGHLADLTPVKLSASARAAERYISWLLLLAVGCEMVWAGFFHVFFPETAASFIN